MMASKSSQVWLLVFGVLALTIYTERASAANLFCASGTKEYRWQGPTIADCEASPRYANCEQWCPDHGREFSNKTIFFEDNGSQTWYDCICCCGSLIRSPPPPSPPTTSPPPPSMSPTPPPSPPSPASPSPPPSPPSPSPPPPCPSTPPSGSCCGCCNTDINIQISIKSGGDNVQVSPSSTSTGGTCNAL